MDISITRVTSSRAITAPEPVDGAVASIWHPWAALPAMWNEISFKHASDVSWKISTEF